MRRRWLQGTLGAASLVLAVGTLVAIGPAQAAPHASGALEFDEPSGLAFGGGNLWVTNEAGNSVTEINPASGAWVNTFTRAGGHLFSQPIAITAVGTDLFVANANDTVSEMSANNGEPIRIIRGAKYHLVNPVSITSTGHTVLVLNAGHGATGSITEINARTGSFMRTISGASFAFDNPAAFTVSGTDVFVADEGNNSMTEVNAANGALVRVVAGEGLDAPDGIAVQDGEVWVADNASSAATEINASSGTAVSTFSDPAYGFWHPTAVIGTQGNVYVMTPLGTSPMVTKVSATDGTADWYMCNTNGPYYFSLLSAFAVSGDDLWVASRSGANSATPAAATGSLTEMSITTGDLIGTFPPPPPTTTTSSTTTTTS